jgi:preprotein translocase subunit SecG
MDNRVAMNARDDALHAATSRTGFAWDPRILGVAAPQVKGYGVAPRTVRARARTVRAARNPEGKRARQPWLLVIAGALVGLAGWLGMAYVAVSFANQEMRVTPGDIRLFLLSIGAYLAGVGVASWAWELGNAPKALKLGLVIALLGLFIWAIVAVVAIVLVLLVKEGDMPDLGGLFDGADFGTGGIATTVDRAVQGADAAVWLGQGIASAVPGDTPVTAAAAESDPEGGIVIGPPGTGNIAV